MQCEANRDWSSMTYVVPVCVSGRQGDQLGGLHIWLACRVARKFGVKPCRAFGVTDSWKRAHWTEHECARCCKWFLGYDPVLTLASTFPRSLYSVVIYGNILYGKHCVTSKSSKDKVYRKFLRCGGWSFRSPLGSLNSNTLCEFRAGEAAAGILGSLWAGTARGCYEPFWIDRSLPSLAFHK